MDHIELSATQYRVTGQSRPEPQPLDNPAWKVWATIVPIWLVVILALIGTQDLFVALPGPGWGWGILAVAPSIIFWALVIINDR